MDEELIFVMAMRRLFAGTIAQGCRFLIIIFYFYFGENANSKDTYLSSTKT